MDVEALKKRYRELVGTRKEIEVTGDLREDLAKIMKKELLKAQVKRIMIEIENM